MTTRNADLLQAAEAAEQAAPGEWDDTGALTVDDERMIVFRGPGESDPNHYGLVACVPQEAVSAFIALANPSRIRDLVNSEAALVEALRAARWYVADALEAHEHSDGRDLLTQIDAALARATDPAEGE